MADFEFAKNPASESCRRIDFEKAEVHPGIIPDTWFLTVSGTKPCLNMQVSLVPLIYIRCPEYWGIEVIGCLSHGVCLTALGPYSVTIPLAGITGSKGVEVFGARKQQQIAVSGGCKSVTPAA
jgi:hypothetical protein